MGIYQKEMKTVHENTYTVMFIVTLFTCLLYIIPQEYICIYHTQQNIIHPWEKGNSTMCNNMDGPLECSDKWDYSERERKIAYGITYLWNLN